MSETMNSDAARKAFYAAMAKAQGKIEGATKDKTNPGFKSKYADLSAVWDACREPLSSNGLAVLQFPDYDPESKCVLLETILTHSDGFDKSFRIAVPVSKIDAQGIGSAITYARRYALMAAVGIAPEDDDGNAAVAQNGEHKAPANSPTPSQTLPKGPARELYNELQQDIDSADSTDALTAWASSRNRDIETLPADWRKSLRSRYADKMADLKLGVDPRAA